MINSTPTTPAAPALVEELLHHLQRMHCLLSPWEYGFQERSGPAGGLVGEAGASAREAARLASTLEGDTPSASEGVRDVCITTRAQCLAWFVAAKAFTDLPAETLEEVQAEIALVLDEACFGAQDLGKELAAVMAEEEMEEVQEEQREEGRGPGTRFFL